MANYGTQLPNLISTWQSLNYLRPSMENIRTQLFLTKTKRMPTLTRADHLLIKVESASLNPIDLLLLQGYGASSFNLLRRLTSGCGIFGLPNLDIHHSNWANSDLPLTPGRDFAGQIVDKGPGLSEFAPGTKVAGATWPFLSSTDSGSLSQYLLCPAQYVAPIPHNVSSIQAAALAYAGLTAWSTLVYGANLKPKPISTIGARPTESSAQGFPTVLIVGASGGVGMVATQLCKLWGACVHVTCPADLKAVGLMKNVHADEIITYPDKPPSSMRYDIILNCLPPMELTKDNTHSSSDATGNRQSIFTNPCFVPQSPPTLLEYLHTNERSRYVTLSPPLIQLADQWGPIVGTGLALSQLIFGRLIGCSNPNQSQYKQLRWSFFKADGQAMHYLLTLASKGLLHVPIHQVFEFDQVPEAFQCMQQRGVRGKIVINIQA